MLFICFQINLIRNFSIEFWKMSTIEALEQLKDLYQDLAQIPTPTGGRILLPQTGNSAGQDRTEEFIRASSKLWFAKFLPILQIFGFCADWIGRYFSNFAMIFGHILAWLIFFLYRSLTSKRSPEIFVNMKNCERLCCLSTYRCFHIAFHNRMFLLGEIKHS